MPVTLRLETIEDAGKVCLLVYDTLCVSGKNESVTLQAMSDI